MGSSAANTSSQVVSKSDIPSPIPENQTIVDPTVAIFPLHKAFFRSGNKLGSDNFSLEEPLNHVRFVPTTSLSKEELSLFKASKTQSFSWNKLSPQEILDTINNELGFKPKIEFSEVASKIIETNDFQRLAQIKQMSVNYTNIGADSDHSRAVHSIIAYVHGKCLASRLGMSKNNAEICGIICLLHDFGHSALQHVGESFLQKTKEFHNFDHDQFAKNLIKSSEVGKILKEYNLPVGLICEIISTESHNIYHDIKEIADRSSYLGLDTINSPFSNSYKEYNKFAFNFICNFVDIIDGKLVFADRYVPLVLLNHRHHLFKNFSCSPVSALVREVSKSLLQNAVDSGDLLPQHLINHGDNEVISKLSEKHQEYFYLGFDNYFKSHMSWIVPEEKCEDPQKVKDRLSEFLHEDPRLKDFAFVCLSEDTHKEWSVRVRTKKSSKLEKISVAKDKECNRYLFVAIPSDEPENSVRIQLLEHKIAEFYESKLSRNNPRAFVNPDRAARTDIIKSFATPELIDPNWLEKNYSEDYIKGGLIKTINHFK